MNQCNGVAVLVWGSLDRFQAEIRGRQHGTRHHSFDLNSKLKILLSSVAAAGGGASCWRRRWAWRPRKAEAATQRPTAASLRACCCCRRRPPAAPQRCCAGLQPWTHEACLCAACRMQGYLTV